MRRRSRVPLVAPSGPLPAVPVAVLPLPEEENEEDAQMENEAPETGAGVGDFVSPSKKKVIKSTFRKILILGKDEPALPATEEDDAQGTQLG